MSKDSLREVHAQLKKVMDLAEPYMKPGVGEDWQEFISTVQKVAPLIKAHSLQERTKARIEELRGITMEHPMLGIKTDASGEMKRLSDRIKQLEEQLTKEIK